eukprot:gene16491-7908_t
METGKAKEVEKSEKETMKDTPNGLAEWKLSFLLRFAGPKSFCFVLFVVIFCQSMATSGMLTASLRDIEKQFGFSSTQAALGAICTALPKFISGEYVPPGANLALSHNQTCMISNTTTDYCIKDTAITNSGLYLILFSVAQMILGVGATPLLTLGVSYIDENVDPSHSPVYMGLIYCATFVGSTFGLIITGFFLKTFVELELPPGFDINVTDQRWIGAWWLGFVCISIVIFVFSLMVFPFPRSLPGASAKRKEAIAKGLITADDEHIEANVKGFVIATKQLIKNKVYIFAVGAVTANTVFGAGFGSSFPKFLILKFGASTDIAGIASGAAIMPAMLLGIMAGSVIMRKMPLQDSIRKAARFCTVMSFVLSCFGAVFMIPGCREPEIVGAVLPYQNGSSLSLNARCNIACDCDRSVYNPGCGSDGKTYFSPCYAGCLSKSSSQVYGNCSCVAAGSRVHNIQGSLSMGECNRDCKNLYFFLAGVCLVGALAFLKATPHKMLILRAVPDNQRSYALGIQLLIVRLLGFIPSPVLIGVVIDSNCILWSKTVCGKQASCLAYQNYQFSVNVAIFCVATSVVSLLGYGLAWYFCRNSDNTDVENALDLSAEEIAASNETIATTL